MSDNEDLIHENFEENDVVAVENIEEDGGTEPISGSNENDGEDDADKTAVKPKRIIRNPQPRLNAETLKGKRGLTALPSYFERVKFKGKGYEEQDLGMILKTYEYWCHRLFPKYPFDECIAKIEHLGKKRAVVTHIKRIRTDLIYEDEPIVNDDHDHDSDTEQILDNVFDDLLQAPIAPLSTEVPNTQVSSIEPPAGISEEQMERMRLNKERAARIRRERLRQTMALAQSSKENDEDITGTGSSQLHVADPYDYQKENEVSDRNETDFGSASNWMNSSQPHNSTETSELSQQTNSTKRTTNLNSTIDSDEDMETNSQPQNSSMSSLRTTELDQAPIAHSSSSQMSNTQISNIDPLTGLSEEQMERMRLNKERAEKIRRDRVRQTVELAESSREHDDTTQASDLSQTTQTKKRTSKINSIIDSDEDMETNSQGEHNSLNTLITSTEVDQERQSQKINNSIIDSDEDIDSHNQEHVSSSTSKKRPTKYNSIIDSDDETSNQEGRSPGATSTDLIEQKKSPKRRAAKFNSIIDSDED